MTDQNRLKQLALTSNYTGVPVTAAQMLIQSEDLLDVTMNARLYSARVAALEKLADNQNALYEVVLKGDSSIGADAIKMITDSKLLHKIALNSPHDIIRGTKDLNAEHYTAIQRIKKRPARRPPRPGEWAGNGRGGRVEKRKTADPNKRISPFVKRKEPLPAFHEIS